MKQRTIPTATEQACWAAWDCLACRPSCRREQCGMGGGARVVHDRRRRRRRHHGHLDEVHRPSLRLCLGLGLELEQELGLVVGREIHS